MSDQAEQKHTPGPWRLDPKLYRSTDGGRHAFVEVAATGKAIWIAKVQTFSDDSGEMAANAALIASAPDLLAERDRLRAENERMHAAILNQCGDNMCWFDTEGAGIPPREQFLESCSRFHAQMSGMVGVLHSGHMTIAQLEAEVQRLLDLTTTMRASNAALEKQRDELLSGLKNALSDMHLEFGMIARRRIEVFIERVEACR